MNRLGIALVLAIAAVGASATQAPGAVAVFVEGNGKPAVASDAGLSEDARAQQAIDAATAAALIGALETRFDGYAVEVRLGNVSTERASLRDVALRGEASMRLGKDQDWLPFSFDALYDTTEQAVLDPNIVLGSTFARAQPADRLPLAGLQAQVHRAMDDQFASNEVVFELQGARVIGDDGVRLVVQADGVARFDGDEDVAVMLQALYDRSNGRWLDPQYALVEP